MKAQVLQENLQRGLSVVGRAVATRSTLPITANVLVATDNDRLKLSATDLEISISSWIGARIDEEGATTVPSRLISDFVSNLPPAPVDMELPERGRQVKLSCARNESTINAMDAEDFPRIPSIEDGVSLEVDAKVLKAAIDRVEFASAADDSRPILTGVHMKTDGKKLTLASADGFRLAVADIELAAEPAEPIVITVPARAVREVARFIAEAAENIEIRVNQQQTQILFAMTDTEVVAQLIQGTFPNYTQLIPGEYTTRSVVDVEEFQREARIAAIFARDGSGIVRLQIQPSEGGPGKITVSARADEVGDNEGDLDAKIEGDTAKIAFNSRYLQDVLAAINGDIVLETTGPSASGVFRQLDDTSYVHVIMPMFVQW